AQLAGTHREHPATLRLLLGGVGQENAAGGLFLRLQRFDNDTVIEGTNLQVYFLFFCHDRIPHTERGQIAKRFFGRPRLPVHATHAAHTTHTSHATHATHATHAVVFVVVHLFLGLLRHVRNERFGGEQQAGDAGAVLQGAARHLDRVDDAGLAQVGVLPAV